MRLVDLCDPLFQYVCRLNRSARKGAGVEPSVVRADVKQMLAEMRAKAGQNPALSGNFEKVELPLIYFVDAMIEESGLAFAKGWSQNRLQTEMKGVSGGDEHFFELLDETLADPSEAGTERLAVFYCCLGLGFTGWYTGQPEYLRRKMMEISSRLRAMIDTDRAGRIVPEAYENVDTSNLIQPPARSVVGFAVALVVVMLTVLVMNGAMYFQASGALRSALENVRSEGSPAGGSAAGADAASGADEAGDEGKDK